MTDLRAIAADIADERGIPTSLDGFVEDEPTILWPGTDFQNGTLYMTFPGLRDVPIFNKKGEETSIERKLATYCVTSEGQQFWYEPDEVMRRGHIFPQTFTQESESRWPRSHVRDFLAGEADNIDPTELFGEIHTEIFDHVEYTDPIYYDIIAYYILLSYVFRAFNSISYIHFNGTKASGKSQNLRILSYLGFNAVWASNMSAASLYRQVAGCPGMLCIDEAESFDGERGEEIRRLLNAGYTSPGYVPRAEKVGDRFTVIRFATFAPKVLASINPLEPVIASRCIIVPMQPSLRRLGSLEAQDPKWPTLRNKLYLWAMQQSYNIGEIRDEWQNTVRDQINTDLKDRQWELALPFIVLGEHVGGRDEALRLVAFFETHFEQQRKNEEETDRLRLLLKCLPQVMLDKDPWPGNWYHIKDIHDVVAERIDEDQREYYRTKTTSKHLTALGWRDRKSHKGGPLVQIIEQDVRDQFRKRNLTPEDGHERWWNGELNYQDETRTRSPEQEAAPQASFNFGDSAPDDGSD